MAHSRVDGGVYIEGSKTSYLMNPGVGYTLGGGFHCTTFECIAQIFREGLRPGGGGDRINTFLVPFAPWDERSQTILRFKRIDGANLVYIYMTYESLSCFSPRVSADGHILVQQTIPFDSFDAVWYYDWKSDDYYRLMVTKGYEQIVLSVKGANKIATLDRFDSLIRNVVPDESSPDVSEIRRLIDIKTSHFSGSRKLFPGHPEWNDAISLLAIIHRPNKEGHRLCPACLCETPATLSICVMCKGYLISHGMRRKIKVTVASMPTAEPRPQEEEVRDHVKQAWEKIKTDQTNEEAGDDQEPADDDVKMEEPPEEQQQDQDDMDQKADDDDLDAVKRDFRGQDEVDQYINEQGEEADAVDEENADEGEINIEEFQVVEAEDVETTYPAWIHRIEFGSKILPKEPCLIGDAQTELIKILLLQMGINILRIYKQFHRNFCGPIETAWQHFQQNSQYRLDLDPKGPYLGEDEDGVLVEPSIEQMKFLYQQIGKPGGKEDIGEDGFVNAYHGSLIFKKLIVHVIECGYSYSDLQGIFTEDTFAPLQKADTTEQECKKASIAREALDTQAEFVRRIIAGAYNVNAVYFFRNVEYQYTVTLDPVDIVCACRPQIRRIAVLHLILQNGKTIPHPMKLRLYDAIDEYNRVKQREDQRPKWGIHMAEAHIAAIADTPIPPDARREMEAAAKGKGKEKAKAAPKSSARSTQSTSSTGHGEEEVHTPKQPPMPPPTHGGKDRGKGYRSASHSGGDWNYDGSYQGWRGWR